MNEAIEYLKSNKSLLHISEIIPNSLYFATVRHINNGGSCDAVIHSTDHLHFFCTDLELVYHNFYGDFGPLSLANLYKFCRKLLNKLAVYGSSSFYDKYMQSRFGQVDTIDKMKERFVRRKAIVYYTSTNTEKRANAAFLISAFSVLYLGLSPRQAYRALQPHKCRYRPFQDASIGLSPYRITVKDCLDAVHKASVFGFFNFNDFSLRECCHYETYEHGDINWIVPQKILSFPGPVQGEQGFYHSPYFYVEYFLSNNVTDIVRLNHRTYDARSFTRFNLRHHDLSMQDGADPPELVLKSFLKVVEAAAGAVAIHCKAGLGRTGTLIGAYLVKHYRMTAKESIAWIRICRPGSVIGHQQVWLEEHEEALWYEGNQWRIQRYGKTEIVPFLPFGVYSFKSPKNSYPGLSQVLATLQRNSKYSFFKQSATKKTRAKLAGMIKTTLEGMKVVDPSQKEPHRPKSQARIIPQIIPLEEVVRTPIEKSSHMLEYKDEHERDKATDQEYNYSSCDNQYSKMERQFGVVNKQFSVADRQYSVVEQQYGVADKQYDVLDKRRCDTVNTPQFQDALDLDLSLDESCKASGQVDQYQTKLNQLQNQLQKYQKQLADYQRWSSQSNKQYLQQTNEDYVNPNFYEPSKTQMTHTRSQPRPRLHSSSEEKPKLPNYGEIASRSVDKNWKLKGNHYNTRRVMGEERELKSMNYGDSDDVCAFDMKADEGIKNTRYNKAYLDRPPLPTLVERDYEFPTAQKTTPTYNYKKQMKQASGLLISPDDVRAWVENFEKDNGWTQGDRLNAIKRNN